MQRPARVAAQAGERGGGSLDGTPVPARVGDEQDGVLNLAISLLQVEPALEGLEIVEDCLGLDGNPPTQTVDDHVPGSKVALKRERNLVPRSEARVEDLPQSIEEPLLADIPNGVSGWIRAHHQIEPDRRTPRADVGDRCMIRDAPLEAQQLLMGGARRVGDHSRAEPGPDSRRPHLATEPAKGIFCATASTIGRALPGAHGVSMHSTHLMSIT
jgi:hypothetical protein